MSIKLNSSYHSKWKYKPTQTFHLDLEIALYRADLTDWRQNVFNGQFMSIEMSPRQLYVNSVFYHLLKHRSSLCSLMVRNLINGESPSAIILRAALMHVINYINSKD